MAVPNELEAHAKQFATTNRKKLVSRLGIGQDGEVWSTEDSAIKAFARQRNYRVELGCYQRLAELGVSEIVGLSVPRLISYDDALMVIEMDIVKPPYLLDFGKAYLDETPPYSDEQLQEWHDYLAEEYGHELPRIMRVLASLRKIGIHYLDVKKGNIVLASEGAE